MEHNNGQHSPGKQAPGQPANACKDDCKENGSKKPGKFGQPLAGNQAIQGDKNKPDYNSLRKHA